MPVCMIFYFLLQGITLVIILLHTFFPISYEGSQIYWKNPLNRLKVLISKFLLVELFSEFFHKKLLSFCIDDVFCQRFFMPSCCNFDK